MVYYKFLIGFLCMNNARIWPVTETAPATHYFPTRGVKSRFKPVEMLLVLVFFFLFYFFFYHHYHPFNPFASLHFFFGYHYFFFSSLLELIYCVVVVKISISNGTITTIKVE